MARKKKQKGVRIASFTEGKKKFEVRRIKSKNKKTFLRFVKRVR